MNILRTADVPSAFFIIIVPVEAKLVHVILKESHNNLLMMRVDR